MQAQTFRRLRDRNQIGHQRIRRRAARDEPATDREGGYFASMGGQVLLTNDVLDSPHV